MCRLRVLDPIFIFLTVRGFAVVALINVKCPIFVLFIGRGLMALF
jgi:hypothetical protein